ncbi:serine/threonine-protein kinase [Nocardia farcinica]|uniref:serine/threonine-protein kinase n=1 Tax=Nocardia farcinica TaxID=37329 RepID=UPI002458CC61|nr:protein kinase [Nocardia farcinica]
MEAAQFGPYRLERPLGSGGMGQVWAAHDTRRGRRVALKLLPADLAADDGYRARFEREAELAATLRHPHIVPIHGHGAVDGRLYIEMELVEGTDLGARLAAGGPLDPSTALDILDQVAAALDAAHAAGLVHRDVKPSNILLRPDGFAYLIDFGIARGVGQTSLTATGLTIGTWAYMAPERFSGHADARSDVYSLACVLFESLTGRRPYGDTDPAQQMHGHLMNDPPRAAAVDPTIGPRLDAVIAHGMAKDPAHRHASAGEFLRAARAAHAGAGAPSPTRTLPAAGPTPTKAVTAHEPAGRVPPGAVAGGSPGAVAGGSPGAVAGRSSGVVAAPGRDAVGSSPVPDPAHHGVGAGSAVPGRNPHPTKVMPAPMTGTTGTPAPVHREHVRARWVPPSAPAPDPLRHDPPAPEPLRHNPPAPDPARGIPPAADRARCTPPAADRVRGTPPASIPARRNPLVPAPARRNPPAPAPSRGTAPASIARPVLPAPGARQWYLRRKASTQKAVRRTWGPAWPARRPGTVAPPPPRRRRRGGLVRKLLWATLLVVLAPFVLAVGCLAALAANSGDGGEPATGAPPPAAVVEEPPPGEPDPAGPDAGPAPAGTPVRDGKFEFRVAAMESGVPRVGLQTARGAFAIVTLAVRNISDQPKWFLPFGQKLVTGDGTVVEHDTTATAWQAVQHRLGHSFEVAPGASGTAVLVFDVPAHTAPAHLELHDFVLSGGVTVAVS